MKTVDFIGDIHGHTTRLEKLLTKLGYVKKNGTYRHSERKAIFVGDYIDRGPDNPGTIRLVRKMVEADAAIALCGNHEYNAICFNTLGANGYLRPHTAKNIRQHAATLQQFEGKKSEYLDAINWFKTLPLFLETDDFRVVHACWDEQAIEYLKQQTENGVIPEGSFEESADKTSALYRAVDITCKGKEMSLPAGLTFSDKDGNLRQQIRIKWWLNPVDKTVKQVSVVEGLEMPDHPFETTESNYYAEREKPIFFGHYWLKGKPNLFRDNVCCVDYSVAKNGYLCCYRYNGEMKLSNEHFVFI